MTAALIGRGLGARRRDAGGAGQAGPRRATSPASRPRRRSPRCRAAGASGVALARELVRQPDLLLLDEPTNHLDVESIEWLEELLAASRFATITVTHDRLFLQRVATRILELDRRNAGGLLAVAGDYADLRRASKAETMHAQERRETVLRNTLRRETEWLRRGAAARSTKQQARIARAGALADEVAELGTRNTTRTAVAGVSGHGAQPAPADRGARASASSYGERTIFAGVDLLDRAGHARRPARARTAAASRRCCACCSARSRPRPAPSRAPTGSQVAYFAQARDALDPTRTVANTVCPDGDYVSFRGRARARPRLPGALPVHAPSRRHGGRQALGRRAEPAPAGAAHVARGAGAGARRADERSRSGDPGRAGGDADRVRRGGAAGLARSLLRRSGRDGDPRVRERTAGTTRGRPGPVRQPGAVGGLAGRARRGSRPRWLWSRRRPPARPRPPRPSPPAASSPTSSSASTTRSRRRSPPPRRPCRRRSPTARTPPTPATPPRLIELLGLVEQRRAEVDRLYARWAELEAKIAGSEVD